MKKSEKRPRGVLPYAGYMCMCHFRPLSLTGKSQRQGWSEILVAGLGQPQTRAPYSLGMPLGS